MQALSTPFASLEPATWKTLGFVVAGLALTHFVLSWSIKYKARRQSDQQQPEETGTQRAVRRWIWQGAIRCILPLAALIWVNGLHFALVAVATDLEKYSFAPTVLEALDWLRAGDRFDIGLFDLQMPGLDGLELAAAAATSVNGSRAPMPVVILSSIGLRDRDEPPLRHRPPDRGGSRGRQFPIGGVDRRGDRQIIGVAFHMNDVRGVKLFQPPGNLGLRVAQLP